VRCGEATEVAVLVSSPGSGATLGEVRRSRGGGLSCWPLAGWTKTPLPPSGYSPQCVGPTGLAGGRNVPFPPTGTAQQGAGGAWRSGGSRFLPQERSDVGGGPAEPGRGSCFLSIARPRAGRWGSETEVLGRLRNIAPSGVCLDPGSVGGATCPFPAGTAPSVGLWNLLRRLVHAVRVKGGAHEMEACCGPGAGHSRCPHGVRD
jgi:hypothetical protein